MCSTPSSIVLTYFDIPGPAEAIRLTFYIAGVPFEDKRITRDEFAVMKKGVTSDDCKRTRFLNEKVGLYITITILLHSVVVQRLSKLLRFWPRLSSTQPVAVRINAIFSNIEGGLVHTSASCISYAEYQARDTASDAT